MEVSDEGIGVPDDINIFELFKTTKPGGTGLGLPLVQQIVSAHNGKIAYKNKPGRGATFKVSLPLSQTNAMVRATTLTQGQIQLHKGLRRPQHKEATEGSPATS